MSRPTEPSNPPPAGESPSERRLRQGREVIRLESETLARLEQRLSESFGRAVDLVLGCKGLLVVTGMGKAGLIGQKVSATFASTGTPSIFLHPAEALHGDLGRIRAEDVVLGISNSGATPEVAAILTASKRIGAKFIAMTGEEDSNLARLADELLDIGRIEEACPLQLAPTASTSAMLALGDALAMVVLEERGFGREDYARFHPAGSLGRRLMRVVEVMRQGEELPLVTAGTPVSQVLMTMTETPGRPGAAIVVDPKGRMAGIFTDGDLRRLIRTDPGLLTSPVDEFMGREPKSVGPDQLVEEAQRLRQAHKIDQIPVVDDSGRPVGLLDVQDLLDLKLS